MSALTAFKPQIRVCKICFKKIDNYSLPYIINDYDVCKICYEEMTPTFRKFKVDNVSAIAIYDYTEKIQGLLYQFKGCFDVELSSTFLERYCFELMMMFSDYLMVPIPSFIKDDEERGFNHVLEMFRFLKLKTLNILVKTKKYKQASNTLEKRKEITKYLKLKEKPDLKRKKILIVDDVYTTGSTMKAAIKLIKELHPRCIKILVMSKAIFREEKEPKVQ